MAFLGGLVNAGSLDQRLNVLRHPSDKAGLKRDRLLGDDGLLYTAFVVLNRLTVCGVFQSCATLDIPRAVAVGLDCGIFRNCPGKLDNIQVAAAQNDLVAVVDGVGIGVAHFLGSLRCKRKMYGIRLTVREPLNFDGSQTGKRFSYFALKCNVLVCSK